MQIIDGNYDVLEYIQYKDRKVILQSKDSTVIVPGAFHWWVNYLNQRGLNLEVVDRGTAVRVEKITSFQKQGDRFIAFFDPTKTRGVQIASRFVLKIRGMVSLINQDRIEE